jgi:membrane-associated protease RseP (regulator of RpoE activity)
MLKNYCLTGMAVFALVSSQAMAQNLVQPIRGTNNRSLIGEPLLSSKYWLGVQCLPIPPALRSHLNLPERQGVMVGAVVKDSPAAKAGVVQYDVLLRVGGKPLAEPRDLLAAVDAAKETVLKIDLIRGGKPQTIQLTPVMRPEQTGEAALDDQADWNTIQKWLDGMKSGEQGGLPSFNMARPGMILPKNVLIPKAFLPGNMSVVVTQQGDQPAKIVVKRNNENWEVTEKELDKLPADVRPFVEQMLGRNMFGVIAGPSASGTMTPGHMPPMTGSINIPTLPPGMMIPQPFLGGLDPRLEKRFDEIERRMDKLFDMMEKMSRNRLEEETPENQQNK